MLVVLMMIMNNLGGDDSDRCTYYTWFGPHLPLYWDCVLFNQVLLSITITIIIRAPAEDLIWSLTIAWSMPHPLPPTSCVCSPSQPAPPPHPDHWSISASRWIATSAKPVEEIAARNQQPHRHPRSASYKGRKINNNFHDNHLHQRQSGHQDAR